MQRIGTIFRWTWRIAGIASILFTGCFLLFVAAVISGAAFFQQQTKEVQVPKGCALVLAPPGSILEEKRPFNPAEELLGLVDNEERPVQLLLQDIVSGLRAAAKDDRIKLLVVAPDLMEQASLDQLLDIGAAIEQFKASSGKVVIAVADTYSQGQYYLASWSDEIYLNPMGSVELHGFGVFNLYLRELLDKLDVNFHIFRVGAFKSAVEPLLRKDMSPEAKEDNGRWLANLWNGYCEDIARQRGVLPQAVNEAVNNLAKNMKAAGGDPAVMARNASLVDGLKTKEEFRQYLQTLVGSNDDASSFKRVDFSDYLKTVRTDYSHPLAGKDRIAILVAQGSIVYGKGSDGQIGSDDMIRNLRQLRQDKQVKAVVLRIDSGGGSAFASELIRQELLLLQNADKPVVVSMGSMAASGAYWIAADAKRIFASPYTLTGSIGIFGAFPTFERTLAKAGIFNDGIGTTSLAGSGSILRPLSADFGQAMQAQIERGYRRFIEVVAHGRKMPLEDVERIAGGRVWDGADALDIGLVDELGSLEEAVAEAAELVGLPADRAEYFQEPENPAKMLLRGLHSVRASLSDSRSSLLTMADRLFRRFALQYDFLAQGDPQNMYSHCLLPLSVLAF